MSIIDSSKNTARDLATECWTCEPLKEYVELSQGFADKLSDAFQSPMLMLFASLAGLWIVLSGIKLALQMTDKKQIITDFVFISITGVLLGSLGAGLISTVYSGALSIMGAASSAVFGVLGGAQESSGYSGVVALAANGEQAVARVFQAASAIARAGALYEVQNYIYAIILALPYFLLVVVYSSQVIVAIFRATVVGIFAPFLFMAFAFNWGRDMAKAGAKALLAAILVLFACTAALALTIYGVKKLTLDPTQLNGSSLNEFASISNPEFLVILFLGWAGTALMTEGTALANSIAQTALTNAAAGILTAGTNASAMWAAKKTAAGAKFLGGLGAAAVTDGAKELIDKVRNINKPGGGS